MTLAAVLVVTGLLGLGLLLRSLVRPLQWLYVPASVVGGLLGLLLFQLAMPIGADGNETLPAALAWLGDTVRDADGALRGWPGALIAVVFAGLLLQRPGRAVGSVARRASLAGVVVWIIILGEMLVGILLCWLVIRPYWDVPLAFGQLIEAGFAGGHGTATALGSVYENIGFPAGYDLGLFVATFGLVYSVISGIVIVNIGTRRGWSRSGTAEHRISSGLEDRRDPEPVALGRVRGDVLDPFALQLVLVGLAVGVGVALQAAFVGLVEMIPDDDWRSALGKVPLFLFTLIGGLLVRMTLTALGLDDLIDPGSIKRIIGVSIEALIVAAMATLRLEAVQTYIVPLSLLLVAGMAWTAVCILVIAPRLLPRDYWFELGLIQYGMSTGTTAQGMMLLRIIDPNLDTRAAEDYALAAPLSAPFIGGGVITVTLPLIMERSGAWPAVLGLSAALIVLVVLGRWLRRTLGPVEAPP